MTNGNKGRVVTLQVALGWAAYLALFTVSMHLSLSAAWLQSTALDEKTTFVILNAAMLILSLVGITLGCHHWSSGRRVRGILLVLVVGMGGIAFNAFQDWTRSESATYGMEFQLQEAHTKLASTDEELALLGSALSSDEERRAAQAVLIRLGLYDGKIDGDIGSQSRAALPLAIAALEAERAELLVGVEALEKGSLGLSTSRWARFIALEAGLFVLPLLLSGQINRRDEQTLRADSKVTKVTTAPAAAVDGCPGNPEDYDLWVVGSGPNAKVSWKRKRRAA